MTPESTQTAENRPHGDAGAQPAPGHPMNCQRPYIEADEIDLDGPGVTPVGKNGGEPIKPSKEQS